MTLQSRRGAVLVLTLLLLVLLDCVLVGMLEVARQQRRIADNRAYVLELQLAAEGAVRRSLAEWPYPADSAPITENRSDDVVIRRTLEALRSDLVLVTATATATGDRSRARYAASLLTHPPAIPRDADVARSAMVAERVTLHDRGVVSVGPPDSCTPGEGIAIRSVQPPLLLPGAIADGAIVSTDTALASFVDAAEARAGQGLASIVIASADTLLDRSHGGVLLALGDVRLSAASGFRGLLIARGNVYIEAGAVLFGAVHSGGHIQVHGAVTRDGCEVETAIRASGLRFASPVPGRAWLPAF